MQFVALVPVKPPARAKSRLVGVTEPDRRDLAEAFALDTVAACVAASRVARVLVATDDAAFSLRLGELGAEAIPDGVALDLNQTLFQSAAEAHRRWPELVPMALTADLPALTPADLDLALSEATAPVGSGEGAYVADTDGTGTTMYVAAYAGFHPRFGPGSAAAHADGGAVPIGMQAARLRRDVDTLADLDEAVRLGVGVETARIRPSSQRSTS